MISASQESGAVSSASQEGGADDARSSSSNVPQSLDSSMRVEVEVEDEDEVSVQEYPPMGHVFRDIVEKDTSPSPSPSPVQFKEELDVLHPQHAMDLHILGTPLLSAPSSSSSSSAISKHVEPWSLSDVHQASNVVMSTSHENIDEEENEDRDIVIDRNADRVRDIDIDRDRGG